MLEPDPGQIVILGMLETLSKIEVKPQIDATQGFEPKQICVDGIGTALPPFKISQKDVLQFVLSHFPIKDETKTLYKRILRNNSIETRHFAFESPYAVLTTDHDLVNERFRQAAVNLSTESLSLALDDAETAFQHLDFLAVTTCTGYLCPGLSSYLIESVPLRNDIQVSDLVGMGCAAAVPGVTQAVNFLKSHPGSVAAVVCVEICSAAFFMGDEPDVVISNCLFADGASSIILKNGSRFSTNGHSHSPVIIDTASVIEPKLRETLRFKSVGGRLRNVLDKEVPNHAAGLFRDILEKLLQKHGLRQDDIRHWIVHAGGEKVLATAQTALGLAPEALQSARNVLRRCGNLSSASLFFVLEEEQKINPGRPGEWGVMASFGAGFSAYAALVRY